MIRSTLDLVGNPRGPSLNRFHQGEVWVARDRCSLQNGTEFVDNGLGSEHSNTLAANASDDAAPGPVFIAV